MANPPIYIEMVPQEIIDEMVLAYEAETNTVLQPAQVEMLMIKTWALRESLLRGQVQSGALQNLVSFATEPVLDYLGELVGAIRLQATNTLVTIEFTLTSGGVTIPSGTRVSSTDGAAVFRTEQDIIVPVGITVITAVCSSVTAGIEFNGYAVGSITNILDPLAFLSSVTNLDISAGGSNVEVDEEYRERIRLAPDAFGTAGSRNAYKFWAKTANPLIIDVGVRNPVPGTVEIFPLMEDGSVTPALVLDQVYAVCNDDDVRPLTDIVQVIAPTQVTWTAAADLTLYEWADPTDVAAEVSSLLNDFALSKRQTMGQDIMLDQLISVAVVNGVYDVDFGAFVDIVIGDDEYAYNNGISVTVVGTNEG